MKLHDPLCFANGKKGQPTCDCSLIAEVRAKCAEAIFNEEQRLIHVIANDPTDPHYSGVLRGLQRARDIAATRGDGNHE